MFNYHMDQKRHNKFLIPCPESNSIRSEKTKDGVTWIVHFDRTGNQRAQYLH